MAWALPLLLGGAVVAAVLASAASASAKPKKKLSTVVPNELPPMPAAPALQVPIAVPDIPEDPTEALPDWATPQPTGFTPEELPTQAPEGTVYDSQTGEVFHRWSLGQEPNAVARAWVGDSGYTRWKEMRDLNAKPNGPYEKVTTKINGVNVTWLNTYEGDLLAVPRAWVLELARRQRLGA